MVISYYGLECFKVSFGDTTLALNPIAKQSTHKPARFGADIALVSLEHPDYNGIEQMSSGGKEPFVIQGPGEYEVGGVVVRGIAAQAADGAINTIYTIVLEGMRLCFLGALAQGKLDAHTIEAIGDVDVLFVPIGGGNVLDPDEAHKLAVSLEANIIIPMHYSASGKGKKNPLEVFLKEEGAEKAQTIDKLTLKRKDVEGKSGEIVVLGSA